ncbi:Shikimate dehydrogenase [Candidatus Ornithobacterium hominis]|uniref:Shikimate dehydrogenase n=1 Tax=Candidatus Ornithobacterium hominis TaxID=2497989 RepID=A0A383U0Z0_9FLAO|nr:shikimate dehydrogenase [Candidatus Ornithobacterium hominis]MCT7904283.1 shikimate dehydrogenase [Candidatus Ornithobacterium hominis]CAI9429500.1 Shikimate dehydrogenase [Candidatus Ornithobacterium hominis]SZD72946.1 Shikimate dehydrogenase [Candidatus Ornithobacterium hominis]
MRKKHPNFETYGLIGKNISYSFSPKFFEKKFKALKKNAEYLIFDLEEIQQVKKIFKKENLKGCNVTIPYKHTVIPFLDQLDPIAKKINAVNTIAFDGEKKIGYNTDVIGFRDSLKKILKKHHTKALILGNGGAAAAVEEACYQLNIKSQIVSRNSQKNIISYQDLSSEIIEEFKIIINTTPLGSAHYPEEKPEIPYHFLNKNHLCYDLIYNPAESLFLKASKKHGAQIKNGLEMLELQAEASYAIWQNYSQ